MKRKEALQLVHRRCRHVAACGKAKAAAEQFSARFSLIKSPADRSWQGRPKFEQFAVVDASSAAFLDIAFSQHPAIIHLSIQ